MSKKFQPGQHPMTGEKAVRTSVYEIIKMFPKQKMTSSDIAALMPGFKTAEIGNALRGLVRTPNAYPGVHRIGRGEFMFDESRPQQWVMFPGMARYKKVGSKVVPVNRKSTEVTVAQVEAVEKANEIVADTQRLGSFVEIVAMFDRSTGKFVPTDEAVLLRDDKGSYWHATRVG